ncbi:hypothetical protein BGZ96_012774 [Linnemannia gamsii]|uniref:Uncharacterized protein n=1 Tax=Linnemannia gamsii TaxID=64522 RepID=A0ABQ7KB68_9FUNG|nr:hypothetical protein BGZ96_012774 [Linnemannia gamsii]
MKNPAVLLVVASSVSLIAASPVVKRADGDLKYTRADTGSTQDMFSPPNDVCLPIQGGSSDDEMLEEWEDEEDLLRGSKFVSSVGAGKFWFRLEHSRRNPTVGRKFAKFHVVLRNLTMCVKFTLGANGDTLLFQYHRAHKEQQMVPQRPLYEGFATLRSSCIRGELTNLNRYFGKERFFNVDLLLLNPPPVNETSNGRGHREKRKNLQQIFKNLRSISGQDPANESGGSGDEELDDEENDNEVCDVSDEMNDGNGRTTPSTRTTTVPGLTLTSKEGSSTTTKRRTPNSKAAMQCSTSASKMRKVTPKKPPSGRKTNTQLSATNNPPTSSGSKATPTGERRITRSQTQARTQSQTREVRRMTAVEIPPYRIISSNS